MTDEDIKALRGAVLALEHPGLAARLSNIAGRPIELMTKALPEGATKAIAAATTKGLNAALAVALRTIRHEPQAGSRLLHKALASVSGGVGGSFGLAALSPRAPDLDHHHAEIDRGYRPQRGRRPGGSGNGAVVPAGVRPGRATAKDDASESGYFAVRGLLAKSVTEAARFVAERGVIAEGAPVLVRFVAQLASRFGAVVTQKAAAQALPIIGALGGAAVNYVFIDHFQEMARGHFTVRRLERAYGKEPVRIEYRANSRRGRSDRLTHVNRIPSRSGPRLAFQGDVAHNAIEQHIIT